MTVEKRKNCVPSRFIQSIFHASTVILRSIKSEFSLFKPANIRRNLNEIKNYIPRELSKWELLITFIDLAILRYRYKATVEDYLIFEFWKKSDYSRKKVITEGQGIDIWQAFNPPEFDHVFREKYETYQIFKPYFGREIVKYSGEGPNYVVRDFLTRNQKFFIKPNDGCAGIGTRIVDLSVYKSDLEGFLHELQGREWIFEELIQQEGRISQIHPYSINTIRLNTVVIKSGVKIMSAALKVGNNRAIADNFHKGGIAAPVDLERGIINGLPVDRWNHVFVHHPLTGVKLIGFQIPNWQQIINLVNQLAEVVPQVRFVGWDIALLSQGIPIMVEGNVHPGFQVQSVVLENMKAAYLSILNE
jgi:hypothetical protein